MRWGERVRSPLSGAVDLRGVPFKMLAIVLPRRWGSSDSSLIGGELIRNAQSTPHPGTAESISTF